MSSNGKDAYGVVKSHLFQIFLLILFLFAMYKVLVVEFPHTAAPITPPTIQSQPPSCSCGRATVQSPPKHPRRKRKRLRSGRK